MAWDTLASREAVLSVCVVALSLKLVLVPTRHSYGFPAFLKNRTNASKSRFVSHLALLGLARHLREWIRSYGCSLRSQRRNCATIIRTMYGTTCASLVTAGCEIAERPASYQPSTVLSAAVVPLASRARAADINYYCEYEYRRFCYPQLVRSNTLIEGSTPRSQ
eukprot:scaffold138440_cov34-Prasinocladus_malaysianus.AAC.1